MNSPHSSLEAPPQARPAGLGDSASKRSPEASSSMITAPLAQKIVTGTYRV